MRPVWFCTLQVPDGTFGPPSAWGGKVSPPPEKETRQWCCLLHPMGNGVLGRAGEGTQPWKLAGAGMTLESRDVLN